jgi:hypothetical protein
LLVATGPTDVDCPRAIAWLVAIAVLGFEVVLRLELVERRWLRPEVRSAFLGKGWPAHRWLL